MSDKPSAVLVAEIGSLTTRVTLVDVVDGESRMIGRAEVLSSVEPPYQNAVVAVLEATAQIAELTGRQLLHDAQLLMPQNSERDGVDHVVAITSAAGNLSLVITAIASDVSARSALHACHGTYTSILQVVTLDDAAMKTVGGSDEAWIIRQIQTMLSLQPDAVFIAGGLEGGAVDALNRLAHIVALTASHTTIDVSGQQRPDVLARPVIYAGNSEARERVLEALSDRAEMLVVDNVRPSIEQEQLEPARQELDRLYNERILSRLPGLPALRRLSSVPVKTVCSAEGLVTRFIAERYMRRVLTLDVGATSSSAFLASQGRYNLAVLGDCGTGYGVTTILKERGVSNVARWLPFSISETELTHWLLNKALRPQVIPADRKDVLIEYAVTREALALVLAALYDECPAPNYDLVVAGGGVLAHAPHPGLAALTLLDALQPMAAESTLALDLHLDTLGLLPACGALAALNPDAAVTVFDRDVLRNVPLATCVIALGEGRPGEVAVEAELTSVRGHTQRVSVRHGQIARLRLDQSTRGQLTLRPAPGVRIGRNNPGVEVSSDTAAIGGSALGVIIDARGRPLRLLEDEAQRRTQIWEWLVALGVERDTNPYVDILADMPVIDAVEDLSVAPLHNGSAAEANGASIPPTEQPPVREVDVAAAVESPESGSRLSDPVGEQPPVAPGQPGAIKPGSRISLSDLEQSEPPAPSVETPAPGGIENDLAQLRQKVEEPKKRGWFGRKK